MLWFNQCCKTGSVFKRWESTMVYMIYCGTLGVETSKIVLFINYSWGVWYLWQHSHLAVVLFLITLSFKLITWRCSSTALRAIFTGFGCFFLVNFRLTVSLLFFFFLSWALILNKQDRVTEEQINYIINISCHYKGT